MKAFLYTDGACVPNPGRGSWSFVVVDRNDARGRILKKETGIAEETTNNRMEYIPMIKGLRAAMDEGYTVEAFSDSMLLVNAFKNVEKYERNNYKNKKNIDLLEEIFLIKTSYPGRIQIHHIRGHSGVHWNEFCDRKCAKALGFPGGIALNDILNRVADYRARI